MEFQDLLILVLFVAAIAIGWWLGRREKAKYSKPENTQPDYFSGVNSLLNDEKDEAIDSLVEVLEKNSDSLDTHLLLAHMLRRRGQIERAIDIHQNLLAKFTLTELEANKVSLELARDYISVGLYDRAEGLLLQELDSGAGDQKHCFQSLLEIYQETKEWGRAIEVSERLIGRGGAFWRNFWSKPKYLDDRLKRSVAHFYCELALEYTAGSDARSAKKQLKRALGIDADSVRASMQLAQIDMVGGDYRAAIKRLNQIRKQDAALFSEALPLLVKCYQQLGNEQGLFDQLKQYAIEVPSTALDLLLGEMIQAREGDEAAIQFFVAELKKHPSLDQAEALLGLLANRGDSSIETVHKVIKGLLGDKSSYLCQNCGFTGTHLHWKCPSCKQWGAVKPVTSADLVKVSSS